MKSTIEVKRAIDLLDGVRKGYEKLGKEDDASNVEMVMAGLTWAFGLGEGGILDIVFADLLDDLETVDALRDILSSSFDIEFIGK